MCVCVCVCVYVCVCVCLLRFLASLFPRTTNSFIPRTLFPSYEVTTLITTTVITCNKSRH